VKKRKRKKIGHCKEKAGEASGLCRIKEEEHNQWARMEKVRRKKLIHVFSLKGLGKKNS